MARELWSRSALELASNIASKEVSSVEVVQAHLDRIAEVNPTINAVVKVLAESALAAAKVADDETSRGISRGTFHGVPFTIKENIDVAGQPTTQGIPALAEAIPPQNAPIVDRMLGSGGPLGGSLQRLPRRATAAAAL